MSSDKVASCLLRSEEHTSELQSQSNLVCRLLLEKKKKKFYMAITLFTPSDDADDTSDTLNFRDFLVRVSTDHYSGCSVYGIQASINRACVINFTPSSIRLHESKQRQLPIPLSIDPNYISHPYFIRKIFLHNTPNQLLTRFFFYN